MQYEQGYVRAHHHRCCPRVAEGFDYLIKVRVRDMAA